MPGHIVTLFSIRSLFDRYQAKSTSVTFYGTKTLSGKALANEEFRFTLTGLDGTSQTVANDGTGKISFAQITYDTPGVYTYQVKEEATTEGGVTIDSKVYNIIVTVSDDGTGQLSKVISGDTFTGTDLNFANSYQPGRETCYDCITLFRLDEGISLPKTGFSALSLQRLPEKPLDLNYKPLRRTLEIPSVSAAAEIVSVPFAEGEYPVAWLGAPAGLLEGSALPGKGQSVLTGHNHLNTTEAGPFAYLKAIEAGDRIFIRDERGNLQVFVVYANVKVAENDVSGVNRVISTDPQSLTLITCEDERPEGGYASRRVVAAKPL